MIPLNNLAALRMHVFGSPQGPLQSGPVGGPPVMQGGPIMGQPVMAPSPMPQPHPIGGPIMQGPVQYPGAMPEQNNFARLMALRNMGPQRMAY